jgi:hypothetical protein
VLQCLKHGVTGFDLKTKTATIFDGGDVRIPTSSLETVGRAIVGALTHPAETKNRYVYTASFVTTQNEMLKAVEEVTGEKFTRKSLDSAQLHAENLEKFKKGDMSAILGLLTAHVLGAQSGGDFSARHELMNELFGLPKESVLEVTRKALSE